MSDINRFQLLSSSAASVIDDRTQEWILNGGLTSKMSGIQYQNSSPPSAASNQIGRYNNQVGTCLPLMMPSLSSSASAPTLSKLDPNSKPFSPRLSAAIKSLDENENKIGAGGDQDDRLRQIWAKKCSSANNESVKPIVTQHNKVGLNNNDPEFIHALKDAAGDNSIRKDDYGLRSLLRNINESVASLKTESSSVLSNADLGMSKTHVEFYNKKEFRFPYMESPLTNNVVSPLSDYYKVPEEYLHGLAVRQSLPKIELNRLATDLLFFLFYTAVGDTIQLRAADELYNRGWRYNISYGLWVARLPSVNPDVRHKTYEKGLYQYFNPSSWRRETKTMTLYYSELSLGNKHYNN